MAWVLKMDKVIKSRLVHDFDANLSGIGQELDTSAYSMSDVLACPSSSRKIPALHWKVNLSPLFLFSM